jgi:phosphate uptake regulator
MPDVRDYTFSVSDLERVLAHLRANDEATVYIEAHGLADPRMVFFDREDREITVFPSYRAKSPRIRWNEVLK